MIAESLINLGKYPITDLSTPEAQRLIKRCQTELKSIGKCSLSEFLKANTAAALAAELEAALQDPHIQNMQHNVYFKKEDVSFPADHPARFQLTTSQNALAYDRIPAEAGIRAIYNWKPLRQFIAAIVGREKLFLHEDSMAPLNIMMLKDGDQLGWHYDRADFVTTLLLQTPENGGRFEYVSNLRTDEDENFEGLARLFNGTHPDKVSLAGAPGTLTLFQGNYSPHRVSPVSGSTPRINSILSYTLEPGVVFSESARLQFYGRAT